jgi:UDP-N-acetylmuramoyl-tripeptide--D-alanyl-D-alanine ligase
VHGLEAHAEVGRSAATLGVRQLFAVGRMASVTARAAREAGLHEVLEFADVEEAAVALKTFVKPRDVVLIKASRSTGLERIGNALKNGNGSHCKGSR